MVEQCKSSHHSASGYQQLLSRSVGQKVCAKMSQVGLRLGSEKNSKQLRVELGMGKPNLSLFKGWKS